MSASKCHFPEDGLRLDCWDICKTRHARRWLSCSAEAWTSEDGFICVALIIGRDAELHCKKWVFRQHFLGGHPAATSFRASKHSGLVFRSQRCPPNECNGTPQRVFRRTRATRVIGPYRATGCLLLANIVFPHTVSAQSRLYWCFETRADQCWNTIPIRPVLLSTFLCAS